MDVSPRKNQATRWRRTLVVSLSVHLALFVLILCVSFHRPDMKLPRPASRKVMLMTMMPAEQQPAAAVPAPPRPAVQASPPPRPAVQASPPPRPSVQPKPSVVVQPATPPVKPKEQPPKTPTLAERLAASQVRHETVKPPPKEQPKQTAPATTPRQTVSEEEYRRRLTAAVPVSPARRTQNADASSSWSSQAESERQDYADMHVRPVLERLWQQPSRASLRVKNPTPVLVTFLVNSRGEILQPRIKTPSNDPMMNTSVMSMFRQTICVTPLAEAGIRKSSLQVDVLLTLDAP